MESLFDNSSKCFTEVMVILHHLAKGVSWNRTQYACVVYMVISVNLVEFCSDLSYAVSVSTFQIKKY